jgi:Ca-activated chloride channel family protein
MRAQWYRRDRWLAVLAIVLVGVGLYRFTAADGSIWTLNQRGHKHYERGDYDRAAASFRDPYWRAVALFRQGEFAEAAALFAGYDTAEGAFNQGNALVMQGKYELAVARFERALELRPDWGAALTNREIATGRAAALKREGGDMTGGTLAPDEIVIGDPKAQPGDGDEVTTAGGEASDAEMRAIWLRKVQTRPADFLRAKFAYQHGARGSDRD